MIQHKAFGNLLIEVLFQLMLDFAGSLLNKIMSRRPVNPARRIGDGGSIPFVGVVQSKARSSPLLSIGLVLVVLSITILLPLHRYSLGAWC